MIHYDKMTREDWSKIYQYLYDVVVVDRHIFNTFFTDVNNILQNYKFGYKILDLQEYCSNFVLVFAKSQIYIHSSSLTNSSPTKTKETNKWLRNYIKTRNLES